MIGAYRRCVAETVTGFDGLVVKYRGDGLLIYSAIPRPWRIMLSELSGRDWMAGARFKDSAGSLDQALSFGNKMASKGSAGPRLTPDPKVIG